MNWLILVAVAVISDSLRIFIDNYSSDVYFKGRGAVSQKLFNGLAFPIVALIAIAITGFDFNGVDITIGMLLVLAGFIYGIAGVPYYKALEIDDSTNIGIFTQLSPVLYLIFGWFLLDQSFSPMQLLAFFVILSAPFLIVFTTRKRSRKVKIRAVIYAFLYVLIAIIGNILFVKESNFEQNFVTTVSLVLFGTGIADLVVVFVDPRLRKRFHEVNKKSHHKVLRPLFVNCIVRVVQQFSYRGALIAAPTVAIASVASDSAEPIVIFFMGLLLTLIWPKFGREKLEKKTVLVHLIATVLVVVGIVLLQM